VRQYKAVRTSDEVQILRERTGMLRYTYIVCLVNETLLTSDAITLKQFLKKLLFLGFSTCNAAIKVSSIGNDLAETVLWPNSLNSAINPIR